MKILTEDVLAALKNNTALMQELGAGTRIHYNHPADFKVLPCLSYRQEDNIGELFADDEEIGSRISYIIDCWGIWNLDRICELVNDAMESIGFYRTQVINLYEHDTKINHVALKFVTLAD